MPHYNFVYVNASKNHLKLLYPTEAQFPVAYCAKQPHVLTAHFSLAVDTKVIYT